MEIDKVSLSFFFIVIYLFSLIFLGVFGALVKFSKEHKSLFDWGSIFILFVGSLGSFLIPLITTGITLEMWGLLSDNREGYGASLEGMVIIIVSMTILFLCFLSGDSLYRKIQGSVEKTFC